ncbi:MAG: hypothetical protein KDI34_03020 [Halioglobus sp.]|jgi:hypothetical protein|nr:hypothetical protein [Halioglobus sp.]
MKLSYIEDLIDDHGQITLGYMSPVGCVAIANDESNSLAMLKQRPGESLQQLLERLDCAIASAVEDGEYLDEINPH